MNNNKSLFWYGWKARLKQSLGKFIIILGFIIGVLFMINNFYLGLFVFFIFLAIGIYLIATGSSQRFDFQRQSGNIIHGGDGWR